MTDELPTPRDLLRAFDDECETDIVACSICYENVASNKNSCITECGHQFCFACIMRTITSNTATCNLCPICRTQMFAQVELSDDESSDSESDSSESSESSESEEEEEDLRPKASIDQITEQLIRENFHMTDLVAILTGRCDVTFTQQYIDSIDTLFDSIMNVEDHRERRKERIGETAETTQMDSEDRNISGRVRIADNLNFDPITGDYTEDDGCIC